MVFPLGYTPGEVVNENFLLMTLIIMYSLIGVILTVPLSSLCYLEEWVRKD